ncbi:MAG: hypothetical protein R3185_05545, partial [Candidatus Thermoplasmatota archaeon]|nr:hypothetical protein [Candidatus Thermoplasmatota archaeon]
MTPPRSTRISIAFLAALLVADLWLLDATWPGLSISLVGAALLLTSAAVPRSWLLTAGVVTYAVGTLSIPLTGYLTLQGLLVLIALGAPMTILILL